MTSPIPLTGEQLRFHAQVMSRKTKAEGPVDIHSIKLHSTTLLAEYASALRQLLALTIRTPLNRKMLRTDPVMANLYTALWNAELAMEIPAESRLSQVPPDGNQPEPVPGPPPDPQAPQA